MRWSGEMDFWYHLVSHRSIFRQVAYERYWAIFKDPFNYIGRLTKKRTFLGVMFLWIAPMVLSLGPFIGWGGFVHIDCPEIFAYETKSGQRNLVSIFSYFISCSLWVDLLFKLQNTIGSPLD